jgi:GNAT superfamily N-acetyltransferase
MAMRARAASLDDCPTLAVLNHQLIRDEGHANPMSIGDLEARMRAWLGSGEYRAILWEDAGAVVAYAVFLETRQEVYLRQFFVARDRRRGGVGRRAVAELFAGWPRDKRWTVSVLSANAPALAFWRAMGYADYDVTMQILPAAHPLSPPGRGSG